MLMWYEYHVLMRPDLLGETVFTVRSRKTAASHGHLKDISLVPKPQFCGFDLVLEVFAGWKRNL